MSNNVLSITFGKDGILYVGTNMGISRSKLSVFPKKE